MTEADYQRYEELRRKGMTVAEIAPVFGKKYHAMAKAVYRYRRAHRSPCVDRPRELTEMFDVARRVQRLAERVDPVITTASHRVRGDAPVAVIFTSCMHLGSRYVLYDKFERLLNEVLGVDRLMWVGLGDDVEGFLPGFRDAKAVTDQAIASPLIQRRMLALVLDQLAVRGKLLCGCASQHGSRFVSQRVGEDPIKAMYLSRHVPYFDGKGILSLEVGSQRYQIMVAHELPGATQFNRNSAQRRAALYDFPTADVVVSGDKHVYAAQEVSVSPFMVDTGQCSNSTQWLVQVGTAKAGLDKYAIENWSRGIFEWPILVFNHRHHMVAHTRDVGMVRTMIREWR